MRGGFSTFIMDVPQEHDDLMHSNMALQRARELNKVLETALVTALEVQELDARQQEEEPSARPTVE